MPAPAPSAHRRWGCSWDGDPTAATAGRARPGAETGCGAGADSPQPAGRGQGFTHWLSPSSHLSCSRPQTLLQVSGRPPRGEGAPVGRASALPAPRRFSTKDTSTAPAQLPMRGPLQRRWLSWDRVPFVPFVPFGSSCSCPLPPPLSQGSRWLGLLSHCRTPRTTLSVSPARVNGALSGWSGSPAGDMNGGQLPS